MQHRYVGDIGDYVKLAILRALTPGHHLGVAWWLYPDENHNEDGRHIDYLQVAERWRPFDPFLFDVLKNIVSATDRRVQALEESLLLPGVVFFHEAIPTVGTPLQRRTSRSAWFTRTLAALNRCNLVFVDPDNGLETANYSAGAIAGGKCVSLAELSALSRPDRALVVYHHQTRRKGGHVAELAYWADRLRGEGFRTVDAIRSQPYSPRAFFLINAQPDISDRAQRLVTQWGGLLSWHPDICLR